MSWFAFKGINSKGMNVIVQSMPSDHIVENEVDYIEVPGRNGYLTVDKERKSFIDKNIVIAILPSENQDAIKKWLIGNGDLVLSTEPDIFYSAKIQTIKQYDYLSGTQSEVTVYLTFRCQPEKYYLSGKNILELTNTPSTLNNQGQTSKPIIKINGNGGISLSVNSQLIQVNVNGYLTIDSELMECYKDNELKTFTGPFPELIEGVNNIEWTGAISSIEVIPRWHK